jgi:aspartyl-tRNA(Asn)/glutamyl-tRNA(Gln) amidotransferase subunit A
VSRYGLIANASSLDQIGPVGKNIDDCAALLSLISGADSMDSTCVMEKPFEFGEIRAERLEDVKIGLPRNYFDNNIEEDVKLAVLAAAKEFEAAGAVIEEFEMPLIDYTLPAYYIIACAEGSSNLSRYDGLKYGHRSTNAKSLSETYRLSRSEGFGLEVKKRIMLGSFVLSSGNYDAYYGKAMQVRTLVRDAYNKLFKQFDMILSPVASATAPLIDQPNEKHMEGIFNVPVNLAGLPSAALPCGINSQGLPIGFQLVGSAFSESMLVNAARVYQSRTDHHAKKPGGGRT